MGHLPLKAGDAVLAVDIQNDFCPGGALPVARLNALEDTGGAHARADFGGVKLRRRGGLVAAVPRAAVRCAGRVTECTNERVRFCPEKRRLVQSSPVHVETKIKAPR